MRLRGEDRPKRPGMPAMRLIDITKRFGPTIALDGVSMELHEGEVHALIGENGAGKSTLMNIITGALTADTGRMELNGGRFAPASPADARKEAVALIHQELSLFPHLTVSENILMGQEQSRWSWLDRKANTRRALEVLDTFGHRDISPDTRVCDLPIAARQVVEISRAIAARARIVLMDEPTSSLQKHDVDRLFSLIRRMRSEGISVVFISHFLEEIREIADRFTVLRDGKNAGSGLISQAADSELIGMMVGREITELFPKRGHHPGEVVLEVKNLAAPPGLIDASFELRRGQVLGIAGLMGSGRTEMVRALFGLDSAAAGTIQIGSTRSMAHGRSAAGSIGEGIGYLSEDRQGEGLATSLSVAENITLTRLSACSKFGWLNKSAERRLAAGWAERLAIKTRNPGQRVATLSGGNQQKVALARLLQQDVDILLLDEPTRGIDVGSKAQIYLLIARLAEEGKAVLMVSSYLPELLGMSDRLAVMRRGKLSDTRPISNWTAESIMQTAIGV
jgi:ribose transport system ATP-binding protein